ncbi:MAG: AlpA family phage regulatory protein [Caulobacteraceae bacterium]|jgi:predicted DNA-binding transcriptional regulator AlpA|nr:AlpA family phage regulatory protein [Caulobacteraceae bacterium]MBX3428199.1 AlpA family phage regulatory protein [Hyphomonadaceae bacterium]MCA8886702.1 AlpA family phage regulatory protein [Hyphomonadaceae bacterium]
MKRKPHAKNGRDQARAQPDLFSTLGAAPRHAIAVGADTGAQLPTPANQSKPARTPKPAPLVARPPNGLLRVREAAARLGLSKSTLDKMRCEGRGPRYVKITSKLVGYDPIDLDAYAEGRKRQSTSER